MKQVIDTAPVIQAYESGDECPFCYLERWAEQRAINYVAGPGASYMEPEVRAITDSEGFCGMHLKKLYDFGNALGNGLMMQTHLIDLSRQLEKELDQFTVPAKRGVFKKGEEASFLHYLQKRNHSCYLCRRVTGSMQRYYATFYALIKEPEFRQKVEESKGFCFRHLEGLLENAAEYLPGSQHQWFYTVIPKLFRENLARVQGDLDWFIAKYDYRNATADWKNARDAVSRSMQKLQGIYPADPPYKKD